MSLSRIMYAIVIFLYAALPSLLFAQAQNRGLPQQIVPCSGAVAENNLPACTCKSLIDLAQNIIDATIYIAVFLSAALFVYAGWLYMTKETIQGQKDAKNIFKNVFIGLIIILAAWLVVDTIMRSIAGSEFGGSWSDMCRFFGEPTSPTPQAAYQRDGI